MGRHNQQRRAAKKRRTQARQRRQRAATQAGHDRADPSAGRGGRQRRSPPDVEQLLQAAVTEGRGARFDRLLAMLVRDHQLAWPAAHLMLGAAVDLLWRHGWTPADLVHAVDRQLSAGHVEEVAAQAVADGRDRTSRGQTLHPRWQQQLDQLARGAAAAGHHPAGERLRRTVELLALVARLPQLPRVMPAPGEVGADGATDAAHLDPRMLARVRALLAKAESTSFEQEAEALTAKAQQLIARHAIDEALTHTADDVGDPSVRRVPIDNPYAGAKAQLLHEVAAANRCRAVYTADLGWCTVFGYDRDLDALELLTASLLAQATQAMLRHGSRRDAAGRSRTRSFRRAFLFGFAQRIGERLRRTTDEQVASTARTAGQLVPVLAARDDRLETARQAAFPDLVRRRASVGNATGWVAGQDAAEQANLGVAAGRLPDS